MKSRSRRSIRKSSRLQDSGADVFVIAATPKFAAQAIRKGYDIGWTAGALSDQCFAFDRHGVETRRP